MINRKQQIKQKGFSMYPDINETVEDNSTFNSFEPIDFSKIKVGLKTLQDAVYTYGEIKRADPRLGDRKLILEAIRNNDLLFMRQVSNFFYRISGIYNRLCRYMAYMYKYDWYITPYVGDGAKEKKITDGFNKAITYLDNFQVKKFLGEAALKVMRNGCYYGYVIKTADRPMVQELPPKYCRSRFNSKSGRPVVEFNMRYFDQQFKDATQRMKMLKLFPDEFSKGYVLYKTGKLAPQYPGDINGWYLLDENCAIKFNLNGQDFPPLMSVIPAILDLDEAQGLDKKKMQQQLLKILIQKMPIDKNGDLIFDVDEAQQLHNNAVRMLGKAIGIDVLTTFADVEVQDMAEDASTTTNKSMDRVKEAIYDQAGISQMQFNTDGNIALQKSILNDEASMYNLIQQFESFLNALIIDFNKSPKKIYYRVQILPTTIYNYQNLAKMYKEQTQLGYSKMLPQIALGQSQSSVLATAYFENDVLDLVNIFIPPLMSSTMNADTVKSLKGTDAAAAGSDKQSGRPTNQSKGQAVSQKTIQNKQSQT